ncbi:MAG TPA: EF-hand domain-containing protein [Sphingopyxis sp.]|uniref:EF-hand domain-containing protein n=1 Tax=Sphingopyxis sp. TaxID=1908224 RepID=UPI002BA0289D|nr:EF-hand domain-containing protein [Sphingopyxis sp.]HWW57207.1 EF-hand domain-containing protein [Sphingopyxis sp.]
MQKAIWIFASFGLALPVAAAAQPPQGGGRMFERMDANGDGKLDKAEITKMMEMRAERRGDATLKSPEKIDAFIKRTDANGDGAVDKAELEATRKPRAEAAPEGQP